MARRRFIADEVNGDVAAVTAQNAAHLARVLRARVGQEYEIAAEGVVRLGRVRSVADDRVEFELGAEIDPAAVGNGPFPKGGKDRAPLTLSKDQGPVTLVVAIFKFDRFEWAVEKATELGVSRIVPVIARRTDAHLAQAAVKRVERWRRIAHEASQQSRRVAAPEIAEPVRLKDAVGMEAGLKVLCAESEDQTTLRDVL
ncbi:MAG: RsmE family RNA methyltransferase, partial [Terriglobales bacterium]